MKDKIDISAWIEGMAIKDIEDLEAAAMGNTLTGNMKAYLVPYLAVYPPFADLQVSLNLIIDGSELVCSLV